MPDKRRDAGDGRTNSHTVALGSAEAVRGGSRQATTGTWEEPALEDKPSWQTAVGGVGPYGVMSDMQALGEAPNAKVKARVKPDTAGKKTFLSKGWSAIGAENQETPEATPAPQSSMHSFNEPAQSSAPPVVAAAAADDAADEDYAPPAKGKKKERVSALRATKRQSRTNAAYPTETPVTTKGRRKKVLDPAPVNLNKHYPAEKLQRVVDAAMARAWEVGKPDLADAVCEIWKQSLSNRRLTELLEHVLMKTANREQTDEFQGYVRRAKRKLRDAKKKDGLSAASNSDARHTLPLRSTPKLTPATLDHSLDTAWPTTERSQPSRPKVTIKVKTPSKIRVAREDKMAGEIPADGQYDDARSETSSLSSLTSVEDLKSEDSVYDTESQTETQAALNGKGKKPASRDSLRVMTQDRNLKRSSAEADLPDDERERVLAAKKQKLGEKVARDYAYQESALRGSSNGLAPKTRALRQRSIAAAPAQLSLYTSSARKSGTRNGRAISEDVESSLSEMSPISSKRSTPRVAKAPTKPPGKRAKTKTSPQKKQHTGLGHMSGGAGRESPIGNDDNDQASENNDYCSACGGSGYLLCCDGCDRSFHFTCLDPPLNEDASELNEPWYCFACVARRPVPAEQPDKPSRGLFAPLITSINKRNPSIFALPQEIRDYFEGVSADRTGAFVEAVNTKSRNRPGYDELPDYYKTRDAKNNFILCYYCGKSSQGRRALICCDYCGQHWHLDCVDPPLANAPARSLEGKKLYDWMCPLHIDHEMRKVDPSQLVVRRMVHVRRPRNAKVVDTSLNRGFRNNGIVDVVNNSSDESEDEFETEEDEETGVVHRLPSKGIKLDFIDKVKSTRVQKLREAENLRRAQRQARQPSMLAQANFARRSFAEKQMALNLAQFASVNKDLDLGRDQVETLVGTLIAEAPPEVVAEMTAVENVVKGRPSMTVIPPSPPVSEQPDQLSVEQRRELQMLQELIRRRLESGKS